MEPDHPPRLEPRWPVALAVLAVLFLLVEIPGRVKLIPIWLTYAFVSTVLMPMVAVELTSAKARWQRVERTTTRLFFVVSAAGSLVNLEYLINAIVHGSKEIGGVPLLSSSVAVWLTNVINFSLLYWEIDRGGPETRMNDAGARPDWLFPQEGAPAEDVPSDWRPTFVDYLFLGFSTATAFSPTGALPLTSRAMLLMMLESSISLVTIVVVASRAIGILGT